MAAVVLLGLYGYSWGCGPLTTSDSVYYLAAARSWAHSERLLNPDGSPYTFWAPLYPVLLAVAGAAWAPARAVGLLHAVAVLVGWASWTWLGRQLLHPANVGRLVLPWVLALSTPWVLAAKFVWAETWFLALFSLYAVALYRYLEQRQISWLLTATAVGILLPLQRTSGLFLLAGAVVGLTVEYGWSVWKPQRGALLLHLAVSACAGVAWQVAVLQSGLSIPLVLNPTAVWGLQPLSDFSFVLARWLMPLPAPIGLVSLAYLVAGLSLTVALVCGAAGTGRFGRVLLLIIVIYIAWNVLANVLSRGAAGTHDAERYAGVIFGPIFILLSGALPAYSSTSLRHRLLVLVSVLWLAYPITRVLHNVIRLHGQHSAPLLVPQTADVSKKT